MKLTMFEYETHYCYSLNTRSRDTVTSSCCILSIVFELQNMHSFGYY